MKKLKKKSKRTPKVIFVFGSNLAGKHGKGAALEAKEKWGAVYGKGKGRTGNAYAIPTKSKRLKPLTLIRIRYYVSQFIYYAAHRQKLRFNVTKIGCGLAGYTPKDIAPMFFYASKNVYLPKDFGMYIEGTDTRYSWWKAL